MMATASVYKGLQDSATTDGPTVIRDGAFNLWLATEFGVTPIDIGTDGKLHLDDGPYGAVDAFLLLTKDIDKAMKAAYEYIDRMFKAAMADGIADIGYTL